MKRILLSNRARFTPTSPIRKLAKYANQAKEKGVNVGVYVSATTGEETTGRGAYECSSYVNPNVCVAVDVTYANDYKGSNEAGDVEIGKGGVVCEGSIPNSKLNQLLAQCAKDLNLPIQYEVFAGRTGTDADTMLKTKNGIVQTLFSIPLRYMHSSAEVCSMKDVDEIIALLVDFIMNFDPNTDFDPFK